MVHFSLSLIQLTSKTFQVLIGLTIYFLLCDLYREIVVPVYSFGGFDLARESCHALVVPVLFLLLAVMPANVRNINDLFLLISFYFLLLPAAVLCALQGSDFIVFTLMSFAVFIVAGFWRLFAYIAPRHEIAKLAQGALIFWLPFTIVVAVLAMLALHVNFEFRYSFAEVYDHRFDFNESLRFPLNYLLPFAAGPLVSFLAALSASRCELGKVLLIVCCGALFYGFSTHKAFLFFPFFSLFIYFSIRSRIGLFYVLALVFFSASIAALNASEEWRDIFGSVFANRLVFIPAQIHFVFFEEFSKVGFLYWAESKVSLGLAVSPIPINSVNYIAEIMTGDSSIGANVGWIANGYMNLGLIGIVAYAAIIGFGFAMIGRWSLRFSGPVLVAALSVPILNIVTSNDLLVAMLTGGVLPMLLLLWFLISRPRIFKRYKHVEISNGRS